MIKKEPFPKSAIRSIPSRKVEPFPHYLLYKSPISVLINTVSYPLEFSTAPIGRYPDVIEPIHGILRNTISIKFSM